MSKPRQLPCFRNNKGANCIKCHEIGTEGQMIGPPLTVIGGKLE